MSREQNNFRASFAKKLQLITILLSLICGSTSNIFSATCKIIHQQPPTDADRALLAADYARAAGLFRSAMVANPNDTHLITGLVHALLWDQKVQEAADAVKAALNAAPNSSALLTLRGEVELRQGEPWSASKSADDSFKLDPCNPRTYLLLADIEEVSFYRATARKHLTTAHQLDPNDPEIRGEWIRTLPLKQQILEIEDYLSEPRGLDADGVRILKSYLEFIRKYSNEPHKLCKLVSQTSTAQIPLGNIMGDADHIKGFGLDVKLNGHATRLEIDTGAAGILVSSTVAKRSGLQSFSQQEMRGIGDESNKLGYTAFADSIHIGDLEFQNCAVRVIDASRLTGTDGVIGMDVFSKFLVTLDYPVRKLLLGALPARPGETTGLTEQLETNSYDDVDAGQEAAAPTSLQKSPPISFYDRYTAPEMKEYTPVFRTGHSLILPASLNASKIKLFILDTGAWRTTISPQAAREVTKVSSSSGHIRGISGEVKNVFVADKITFRFANLSQEAENIPAFDTSKISKDMGMEISGLIGANTLFQLTIHIDYRDGLVKFEFDPKRGYH